ncbi:hypothetical protein GQ53DRAFT_751826 [Thozetella sp. PMI_491]|nr:hypothetical protein GQ53DRAFT_751826 [Thozetella sp. PMI_491]
MAMRGGPRLAVGSAAWIAEERSSALQIAHSEIEEFSYSARNELDWLNEHMAEIFSENQMNVAELFKTPGKLRGKTPRTAKKKTAGETRVPLSDVFSSTPKSAPNPFAMAISSQARTPKINIAEDKPRPAAVSRHASPQKAAIASPLPYHKTPIAVGDSGYHGSPSQSQEVVDGDIDMDEPTPMASPQRGVEVTDFAMVTAPTVPFDQIASPTAESEDTFQSAKEEQTRQATAEPMAKLKSPPPVIAEESSGSSGTPVGSPIRSPQSPSPKKSSPVKSSPVKSSPVKSSPLKQSPLKQVRLQEEPDLLPEPVNDADAMNAPEDPRSPLDNSSPIRPIMRKSSLAFASLPAREPLNSNKSLGGRISRTSHLDQTRTSYYQRHTGGKSLGQTAVDDLSDDDRDDMDLDDGTTIQKEEDTTASVATHNKTYSQRLQDQISMLGKAQPTGPRPSKSIANLLPAQPNLASTSSTQSSQTLAARDSKPLPPSPKNKQAVSTPGAFPDDDDDDWIARPTKTTSAASPRPGMLKSYSTDVMEGVGKSAMEESEFVLPKSRPASPKKGKAPIIPERTTSAPKHAKSASVPFLPSTMDLDELDSGVCSPKKGISVSNPTLATVSEDDTTGTLSSKSPSRSFKDSPLKQVKNKLSSILKSSKGLLASSAAISAEGKSSLLSPSTTRLGYHIGPSVESFRTAENVLYPDLSHHGGSPSRPASPTRSNSTRRTRASAEREKREAKEREKEVKEAKRAAEQMDKLEKARRKEEEKARIFSQEQDRIEAERRLAAQREQERIAMEQAQARARAEEARARAQAEAEAAARAQTEREAEAAAQAQAQAQAQALRSSPAKTPSKSPPKPTRTSPRKAKAQAEADGNLDADMTDATVAMPPPSVPRSAASTAASRSQVPKRPIKPSKEAASKTKQAPTVIRVNTSSTQHSQYHPSNSMLASTLQDTLGAQSNSSQRQLNNKSSHASLQTKPSLQSLKSSVSSTGRPKALELAAKRKEQEEREAQRKREVKAEMERKRAALQEEERRREQQRRAEVERQKEEDQKQATVAAQAKKDAQRQAAIEKAKQTRAPPPAVRSQPNGPPEYSMADKAPARPPSRLGSTIHQDANRPVNTVLSNASKMAQKRPLQQEEEAPRPQPQRNPQSYQAKESKRIRMSEEFDEDIEMADSQRNPIKGPPVRPSAGFKKELPQKSVFSSGYTAAPPQSATRDLFKATVTAQHSNQVKAAHPLDMAQVSKGAIPFAPNPNPAGPSHKTPARPGAGGVAKSAAKSATRSSPRFQNGEAIELPDIDTDDEDDDDANIGAAAWTDSPDLRKALMRQEAVDPMQIFGAPAPLNLEEVFNKTKDRWHKFRARTSSANWSGADKLTEDDIRKDLQARDRMRREGGWSYELSRDIS